MYEKEPEPTISTFPFDKLPPFTSHLKPHFAIYHCGRRLTAEIPTEAIKSGIITPQTILEICTLYRAWTALLPFKNFDAGYYENRRLSLVEEPVRLKRGRDEGSDDEGSDDGGSNDGEGGASAKKKAQARRPGRRARSHHRGTYTQLPP